MIVALLTVRLDVPFVHSLKEKRQETSRIVQRLRNKFNLSVAETGCTDLHQTIEISVAAIAANPRLGDSILDKVLLFIQSLSQGDVTVVERSFL